MNIHLRDFPRLLILGSLYGLAGSTWNAQASAANTWTTVAPIPDVRWFPAAASAGGKLYVFAGGGCTPGLCGTYDAYDPRTNTWTSMGAMPVVLGFRPSATTGTDGRIYVYGQIDSPGTANGGVLLIFDPRARRWTRDTPPPGENNATILVTGLDGRIYAVNQRGNGPPPVKTGGSGAPAETISVYAPSTHSWTELKSLPSPRDSPGVAVGPDGRIYVIGGAQTAAPSARANRVDAYNPKTNSWSSVAHLPTARAELQAVTGPDGRIYAIGGGEGSRCLTAPCNVVEAYDIRTNRWTAVASLPHPRWGFAASVGPDGRIYLVSGSKVTGSLDLQRTVDAYTVVPAGHALPKPQPAPTPATRRLASMPTGREGLGAVSSGGKLYAIGGETIAAPQPNSPRSTRSTVLRTVEAYDPKTNRWTTEPPLPTPLVGMGATLGPGGRIYVLGGAAVPWDGNGKTAVVGRRSVEIYDPKTRRWSSGVPMPDGRYALTAVTGADGRIYTIGGTTVCYRYQGAAVERNLPKQSAHLPARGPSGNCEQTGTVRAFDPRTDRWTTLAPLPVAGLLPAAAAGDGGRIYVFAGNHNGLPDRSFQVYDPGTNRWTRLTGMPHRRFNGLVAATERSGRIDLIGGCIVTLLGGNRSMGTCGAPSPVDGYDPRTNTWQTIGMTLNVHLEPAAATGPDGRVYVVGGPGDGNGRLLDVILSSRRK